LLDHLENRLCHSGEAGGQWHHVFCRERLNVCEAWFTAKQFLDVWWKLSEAADDFFELFLVTFISKQQSLCGHVRCHDPQRPRVIIINIIIIEAIYCARSQNSANALYTHLYWYLRRRDSLFVHRRMIFQFCQDHGSKTHQLRCQRKQNNAL